MWGFDFFDVWFLLVVNYLSERVLIFSKNLMVKYVIAMPKLAPRVSIKTSRNWAERPGTKI